MTILIVFISIVFGFLISRLSLLFGMFCLEKLGLKENDYKIKDIMIRNKNISIIKKSIIDIFSVLCVFYVLCNFESFTLIGLIMLLILLFVLLMSIVTDILDGYILNIFTYSGTLLIGVLTFFEHERFDSIWLYIVGFLMVLFIFFIVFLILPGKMGLGDVKLFLLLGLYFGMYDLIVVMFFSTFLGLIYGIYLLKIKKRNESFIFGPFISYGTLLVLLFSIHLPMI